MSSLHEQRGYNNINIKVNNDNNNNNNNNNKGHFACRATGSLPMLHRVRAGVTQY